MCALVTGVRRVLFRSDDATAGPEFESDRCGRSVGHDHLHRERGHLAVSAATELVDGVDERVAAAESGADDNGQAVLIDFRAAGVAPDRATQREIGRASGRERVCKYV